MVTSRGQLVKRIKEEEGSGEFLDPTGDTYSIHPSIPLFNTSSTHAFNLSSTPILTHLHINTPSHPPSTPRFPSPISTNSIPSLFIDGKKDLTGASRPDSPRIVSVDPTRSPSIDGSMNAAIASAIAGHFPPPSSLPLHPLFDSTLTPVVTPINHKGVYFLLILLLLT